MTDQRPDADDVAAHGCTSLRYYGRGGWRCIECFGAYVVVRAEWADDPGSKFPGGEDADVTPTSSPGAHSGQRVRPTNDDPDRLLDKILGRESAEICRQKFPWLSEVKVPGGPVCEAFTDDGRTLRCACCGNYRGAHTDGPKRHAEHLGDGMDHRYCDACRAALNDGSRYHPHDECAVPPNVSDHEHPGCDEHAHSDGSD